MSGFPSSDRPKSIYRATKYTHKHTHKEKDVCMGESL